MTILTINFLFGIIVQSFIITVGIIVFSLGAYIVLITLNRGYIKQSKAKFFSLISIWVILVIGFVYLLQSFLK